MVSAGFADPFVLAQQRSKRRKRFVAFIVLLVVVIIVLGVAIGVSKHNKIEKKKEASSSSSTSSSIEAACNKTLYPDACITLFSSYNGSKSSDSYNVVKVFIQIASDKVGDMLDLTSQLLKSEKNNSLTYPALQDCEEMLSDAQDELNTTMSSISKLSLKSLKQSSIDDINTWLSSSMTFASTCADGLLENNGSSILTQKADSVEKVLSISLSVYKRYVSLVKKLPFSKRRLLSLEDEDEMVVNTTFPTWVPLHTRRLLQSQFDIPEFANATVSKTDVNAYTKIQEAVDGAPMKGTSTYVIYIKAGTYNEYIIVPKNKYNIVFVGDGPDKTIITGSKYMQPGVITTAQTATVVVSGTRFVGLNLAIENTAGPEKNQSVALRVTGDMAAFYNCKFLGYQDTLYAHTGRQFYGECQVEGTVDFIFGNAAALFQNCTIVARKPLANQNNMFTAQSRLDPLQTTGFSIQGSHVDGTADLQAATSSFSSYLGRPWKDYSRVVYLENTLGSVVAPAGWSDWNDTTISRRDTVYYAEYKNIGPGSGTSDRVNWSRSIGTSEAQNFTVANFISDHDWPPRTTASYDLAT